MGLTFHYRGRLAGKDQIKPLVAEVTAICTELDWKYVCISDERVEGICISPANCESLMLLFDAGGRLVGPPAVYVEDTPLPWLFTKTQYAGPETHMALIRLLRYLEGKYFAQLNVNDEGGFWETDDEAVLRAHFQQYEVALDWVANALEAYKAATEKPADLADKLADFLRRKRGEEGNL